MITFQFHKFCVISLRLRTTNIKIYLKFIIIARVSYTRALQSKTSNLPLLGAHGGDRVISASGSKTSVSSAMATSAIIFDAYTSIIRKN